MRHGSEKRPLGPSRDLRLATAYSDRCPLGLGCLRVQDLIKVSVKVGLLYRHNQLSKSELSTSACETGCAAATSWRVVTSAPPMW